MIGAIAGDIVGSVYEWSNVKTEDFSLFSSDSRFTDDTVLTVAVCDSILTDVDFGIKFKEYYSLYPNAGYGEMFAKWARSDHMAPYRSFGNGSAMRVSPVGFANNSLEEALFQAQRSAQCTHNHPEGIKGARAVAIYAAKTTKSDCSRQLITEHLISIGNILYSPTVLILYHNYMAQFNPVINYRVFLHLYHKRKVIDFIKAAPIGYDIDTPISEIRKDYIFDPTCQNSVPQAIRAFIESKNFEGAIRKAISIGGDSDTIACIAGAIAHAFYGPLPEYINIRVFDMLDKPLKNVVKQLLAGFQSIEYCSKSQVHL